MNTLLLSSCDEDIETAADIINNGGLVAMPTETVYGLGANALNEDAVKKIFIAKGRAQDNPLIVHISRLDELKPLVKDIPHSALRLALKFWPGPLTLIMKKSDLVPDAVTCGMDTVAVRMPAHPVAKRLIAKAGCPIAAPSANISGGVSPVSAEHCVKDLNGRIDAIIDGGQCKVGLESTIVLTTSETPRLLRPGLITKAQIENCLNCKIDVDDAILNPLKEGEKPLSPGMKYKHYSPDAKIIIIDAQPNVYQCYVNQHSAQGVYALCFKEDKEKLRVPYICYGDENDDATQAAGLFDAMRKLDELGAKTVYARMPKPDGVGLAVLNRLLRAAGFEVIKP